MTLDPKLMMDGLALVVSIGAMVYSFLVNRRKDVDQRFTDGSRRMDRLDGRVASLEQEVKVMPGKDDVHSLQMTLSDVRGDMKAMAATMSAMAESINRTENIVTRHEDHLRENR
ncbi:DUF2730 family protein [Pseudosulfitobacter pseudonitzschiae]|uniref:DUF2730 family protein n=1 Tax=Pseudosulfitobacter pseudonitzschiae TaxID=1402135 RepID=UPI001E62D914|nr:DUF2730 family protein [Pseudosulfitobacter pseudonitzschiae]MCD2328365.1 DUF2730 domain-containing protein [Pseudosulfitobacter pseudonitzschiae]UFE26925.1 DUF2730 domain-containing protein [Pseudosulfitobacter pseudonitzschiae]UFE32538.1 DUF2730 domain-containing protein [Pseudosulfitobacter pseudonitzschiae]UFE38121.1 DUF2730 domain-containing protein [Pseudosulfitobacter pseudonitzschiae]UFE42640.1 DUF2730 domain-containing protein [Pseudosulfitobacter pseudonitzschiae]